MPTTVSPAELAEYLADTPRTGVTVRLYLDGTAKPTTFDALVMTRFVGALVTRTNPTTHGLRGVELDAADLPELADAIVYAAEGVPTAKAGTLAAILRTVDAALVAHDPYAAAA